MEYLVKISKKARILELKQTYLKIIVLTTNTSYPSRKIRRTVLAHHKRPRRKQDQYVADIDADTATVETAATLEVGIRIEADVVVEVGIGIKREDEAEEEAESRDRGTIKIRVDRVSDIGSA
uniref:Uncharacterized protein n=1 Tax=Tanacetum cinerariifolium TaxID=118510 RepID=A0A6L2NB22_TANCI|nr:hypothetical protein [Tanacetum cinerariifolium]